MSDNGNTSNLSFRSLALWLRLRERFQDPAEALRKAGLENGQVVLDFGCGVGSYTLPAARIVGEQGLIYALDVHPLAIEDVERRARKAGLANLRTIVSGRDTGLPDGSVDVVLLYDVLHAVADKPALLSELQRILKPEGSLSVKPDHMARSELLDLMRATGGFRLDAEHGEFFQFRKAARPQ